MTAVEAVTTGLGFAVEMVGGGTVGLITGRGVTGGPTGANAVSKYYGLLINERSLIELLKRTRSFGHAWIKWHSWIPWVPWISSKSIPPWIATKAGIND